jgi:hypothetical protein
MRRRLRRLTGGHLGRHLGRLLGRQLRWHLGRLTGGGAKSIARDATIDALLVLVLDAVGAVSNNSFW